jgi:hypothetical protein
MADRYKGRWLSPPTIICWKRVPEGRIGMLRTIFIVLLGLWLLGLGASNTSGGVIHILSAVAIVMFLIRFIQGRRGIAQMQRGNK